MSPVLASDVHRGEGETVADETVSAEQAAFFAEPHVAVLATVGPGGRPHAAPVWYLYEDGVFLVSTGRRGQKHRNVERDPRVTLVVDRRELPYYAAMVRGTVEVGPPLTDEQRLHLAVRYLGEERGRAYFERGSGEGSVTLHIRPARVSEYVGTSGRED